MEDIIELLREHHQAVSVPLELPDEDLLIEIEEELSLPLPADYRAFLLNASDLIVGNLEPATITDSRSHTYLPEMVSQAWSDGLPRHYLPICAWADGYYCITEEGGVYYWDETGVSKEEWDTIWDWAREVWLESALS